ncbi:MAG: tetratricopeptide repeat protein [Planctomycetales bacterium]|nr:tetratricopeptide repeat protein [Planctomycetales bacterium]
MASRIYRAAAREAAGDFPGAAAGYEQALALRPGSVPLLAAAGEARVRGGDVAGGLALLGRAADAAGPADPEPRLRLAAVLEALAEPDRAEEELLRATAGAPGDSRPAGALADLLERRGRPSEAAEVLRDSPGSSAAALRRAGDLFREAGLPSEALAAYRRIPEPADAALRYRRALCLDALRDLPTALAEVERLPEETPSLLYRGDLLERLRRFPEAAEVYRRAAERDPGSGESLVRLGRLLLAELGRPGEARAPLEAALALAGSRGDPRGRLARGALHLLGRVAEENGDLDRAVALHREASKADPGDPELGAALGRALLRAGRAQEAVPPLRRAAEALGDDPTAWDRLAEACASAGLERDAADARRRAAEAREGGFR